MAAVSGDAADPAVLIQAHIARARMLVIATPDAMNVRQMIETARTLNPAIETVVRTHNEEEAAPADAGSGRRPCSSASTNWRRPWRATWCARAAPA